VSNVDSNTTLSLDADIMLTGEAYTIDNSPFITQGHYYVVSVGGTTTLNGISNWTIGDWVIAGANNQWTKLDHSQVDGTGTTGNLTKWSSTSVIADSIVSESGSAITVDGSLTTNTNLSSTGNFAVNTDKFTVAAVSGETNIKADVSALGEIKSYYNGANYSRLLSTVDGGSVSGFNSSGGSFIIRDHSYSQIVSDGNLGLGITGQFAIQKVHIQGTGTTYMHIANDSTGSLATDGADIGFFTGQTALQILNRENDSVIISTNDLPRLTIDGSGNSTFAGNVTISQPTNGSDAILSLISKSASGNSRTSTIEYDADNEYMYFKNAGTTVATMTSGGNVGIGNTVASSMDAGANNLVVGSGSGTEGMTIYSGTSNSGVIYFADGASGDDRFRGQIGYSHSDNSFNFRTNASSSANMVINSSGNVGIGTDSPYTNLEVANSGVDSIIRLYAAGGTANIRTWEMRAVGVAGEGLIFRQVNDANNSYTNRMLIDTDGNVGIGTISPNISGFVRAVTLDSNDSGYEIASSGTLNAIFSGNSSGAGLTGIGSSGIRFFTSASGSTTERMRITSAGDVQLVGNKYLYANPSAGSTTIGAGFQLDAVNNIMKLWTNNTERMRIDSSGNVGINVDPSTQLHNLQKTNDRAGGFYTQLNGNNYGLSMFVNSGGYGIIGSNGNFTTDILTMDLNSGNATFAGDVKFTDGAAYSSAASIRQQSNNLIFSGGSDGYYFNKSDNSATHLRITSGGDVEIPTNSAKIKLRSSGSSAYTSIFRDTTNQIVIENTAGTNIFQLDNSGRFTLLGLDGKTQTGSDVRFSTASGELYYNTSSKRYKTDIVNLENSLDKINALRPVRFKDKKTGEATCGLIAEETFEIIPDVVFTKEIEGFDEPQIEGLNYSDLIPFLIKSIQELKAEVDKLKQECKCKN
jgi:hypothetical protein